MALHLPATSPGRIIKPANGRTFTLAELQALVGGYIETLRCAITYHGGDGEADVMHGWMFLNEEGKLRGLPFNAHATALTRDQLPADDVIVGDVVICTPLEAGEGADQDDSDAAYEEGPDVD